MQLEQEIEIEGSNELRRKAVLLISSTENLKVVFHSSWEYRADAKQDKIGKLIMDISDRIIVIRFYGTV